VPLCALQLVIAARTPRLAHASVQHTSTLSVHCANHFHRATGRYRTSCDRVSVSVLSQGGVLLLGPPSWFLEWKLAGCLTYATLCNKIQVSTKNKGTSL